MLNPNAHKLKIENEHNHQWDYCSMCGPMVRCGKCGNNCCNAGYGTLEDGTECPYCESAYEIQGKGFTGQVELIDKLCAFRDAKLALLNCIWDTGFDYEDDIQ